MPKLIIDEEELLDYFRFRLKHEKGSDMDYSIISHLSGMSKTLTDEEVEEIVDDQSYFRFEANQELEKTKDNLEDGVNCDRTIEEIQDEIDLRTKIITKLKGEK
jgi:hypothetical protein